VPLVIQITEEKLHCEPVGTSSHLHYGLFNVTAMHFCDFASICGLSTCPIILIAQERCRKVNRQVASMEVQFRPSAEIRISLVIIFTHLAVSQHHQQPERQRRRRYERHRIINRNTRCEFHVNNLSVESRITTL
jgi:uncharacterized membrane protein